MIDFFSLFYFANTARVHVPHASWARCVIPFLKGPRWHKLTVYATGFPLKGFQLEMVLVNNVSKELASVLLENALDFWYHKFRGKSTIGEIRC